VVRGKIIRSVVQYCVQQLCTEQLTHMNSLTVVCWLDLAFVVILCVSLSVLNLAFSDYFLL